MRLSNIAISTRACTEGELQALACWSASSLPYCRRWVANRGLQPPPDILKTLQLMRLDGISITERSLEPLITVPSKSQQEITNLDIDNKLEVLAADLSRDLNQLQVLIVNADVEDQKQGFRTEARDLRRFQRAISQLQLTQLELVACESVIVTLFSMQRSTLYLPRWLVETLPHTVFEPNASFYRARPASLAWLLLDAIVITPRDEFKTI